LAGSGARDATLRSPKLGPSGRAGRWIGGASGRLIGRQRRRDLAAGESEVEFKGQAERSVEDASRRQDREAEPEMQQPESDVGSSGRAGRLIGGASCRLAGRQRRRDQRTMRAGS